MNGGWPCVSLLGGPVHRFDPRLTGRYSREKIMSGRDHTEDRSGGRSPRTLWAYAYEVMPPQGDDEMEGIGTLLSEEHTNAKLSARLWAGRMVREQMVTHIMVVSDSPDQTLEVNRRLESRLEGLKARYSLSVPMAVEDDSPAQLPEPDGPPGKDP